MSGYNGWPSTTANGISPCAAQSRRPAAAPRSEPRSIPVSSIVHRHGLSDRRPVCRAPPSAPARTPRHEYAYQFRILLELLRPFRDAGHLLTTFSMSGALHSKQPIPAERQPFCTTPGSRRFEYILCRSTPDISPDRPDRCGARAPDRFAWP